MGAWGVGIFQDDVASDVRDEYDEARDKGLNQWAASQKAHAEMADYFEDRDDGPIASVALALEQVRRDKSCLNPDAEAALRGISVLLSEERMGEWEEEDRGRRRAALIAARKRLEGARFVDPEAVRGETAKPRERRGPRFQVGDIVAFPLGIRGLLGFARILQVGEALILVQVYELISETPPEVENFRGSGPLVTFNVYNDGIGRSPDRRIVGHDPVEPANLPTRWYVHESWHDKWFIVPGPFSTPNQRQETVEAEARRIGAADASIILGGILERTDQVCRELAQAGLLSGDDAAFASRRHREFYERYRALPSKEARIQAIKEYRESFLQGMHS